jgi:hypothetical protein
MVESLEVRTLLAAGDPYISEFLASNTNVIKDGDNVYSDFIEIYNPGAAPLNLNGYHLTDEKDLQNKFTFGDFVIPAGGYKIVFASGTAHTDPAGYVHTNFSLKDQGEYLAFSKPDGTLLSVYDPFYPQQSPNVSYGVGPGGGSGVTLLASGAPAKVLVPTSGALGSSWNTTGFGDSTWTGVTTGIGFEANTSNVPPLPNEIETNSTFAQANNASTNFGAAPAERYQLGFSGDISSASDVDYYRLGTFQAGDVVTISLSGSPGGQGTLTDGALELLRGASGATSVVVDNDTGPGTDALIYRFQVTQTDTYYVKASGNVGATGTYDIGAWLENTATAPTTTGNVTQESEPNDTGATADDLSTSWRNVQYLSRTGGALSTDYFKFQFYAGDRVTVIVDSTSANTAQVQLYDGNQVQLATEDGSSDLAAPAGNDSAIYSYIIPTTGEYYVFAHPAAGSGSNGSFNLDVYLSSPNSPPRPAQLTGQFTTSVQGDMFNKNATAYLRVPFNVASAASVSSLNLRVKYEDGFVAYLNGTKVAERDAPGAPVWNSAATADRTATQATTAEDIDISQFRNLLVNGSNVLAIQGLNSSAASEEFLLVPELTAQVNSVGTPQYFYTPTPAAPNIAGAGVVINEIHYNPDVETQLVDFVELFNSSTQPIDVSGWKFTNGITFVFPAGTTIGAGQYLVLAQNSGQFQSKFGFAPFGQFVGTLSTNGEKVALANAANKTVDEVDYGAGFPWPTVGDPLTTPGTGGSIQLINPGLDNDLGGHWRSALPTPGAKNTAVFAANAPPAMRQVENSPSQPTSNQPVTITAKVSDPDGVASVNVQYQVNAPGNYVPYQLVNTSLQVSLNPAYEQGWVTLPMYDDGTHGDATPSDGVYSAQVPASANQNRTLVRYRITATDTLGASIRGPYADDTSRNFAYYVYNGVPSWTGSVQSGQATTTFGSDVLTSLPVYTFITTKQDHANALHVPVGGVNPQTGGYGGDEYLWGGTLVYDGKVYDNVRWRARGGVWRYAMGKNMWKIDFNRNHEFEWRDPWGNKYSEKMKKLNLGAVIQQGDFGQRGEQGLFEYAGFKLFNLAGGEAPNTAPISLRIVEDASENGPTSSQYDDDFQGLYLVVEQEDGQFLKQHDLPDGNLYKMESGPGGGTSNNQGPTQPSDNSDLIAFTSTLNSNPSEQWYRDNIDLDEYFSYRAIVEAIHHWDIGFGKNYFFYHNPVNNKWQEMSWDLDLTWTTTYEPGNGDNEPLKRMLAIPGLMRDYQNKLREIQDLLWNPEQTGQLLDELAALITKPGGNGATLAEADRRMWDYNPIMFSSYVNSSKAGSHHFYETSGGTFAGFVQKLKNYVNTRNANYLNPRSVDATIPVKPAATYAGPAGFPTDELRFSSSNFVSPGNNSTFAAMKWRVAEVYDPSNPAYANWQGERPYEVNAAWQSDDITTFNNQIVIPGGKLIPGRTYRVRVRMKDANGKWSNWSAPVQFIAGQPDTSINALRVTELMYHPADPPIGSTFDADDFEYIELLNTGSGFLDLSGVKLAGGLDFTFPDSYQLAPGQRTLVVSNLAAFQSRYPNYASLNIAGQYTGRLSNGSDHVRLEAASGQPIVDFEYEDGWYPQTDGEGFSLVIINPTGDLATWGDKESWRAGMPPNGAPGVADPGLGPNSIVVNEIMSNPATPGQGWIELRNTTAAPIDISGWFLSDDANNLKKFKFAPGTVLQAAGQAGSILVLNESATYGAGAGRFSLSRFGGTLYTSSADSSATLLGYRDVQDYRASDAGVTLGRYIKSTGRQDFTALLSPTVGASNASPKVGPVVINEVMYNPPAGGNEYVEIRNVTGQTVDLSGWKFDGISYTFPAGASLPAHGYALIVPIDPDSFRSTYNIPARVQIFGPFFGLIDDNGENIELQKPGVPDSGLIPYVTVDRVSYESQFPWPTTPNGAGPSLLRKDYNAYGNDVINWSASTASGGTPGTPNFRPTATGAFDLASLNKLSVRFTEDVSASIQPSDLTITNLSGGPTPAATVSWDPATLTATWTFANPADGNYRATLIAAGITDWSGQALAGSNQSFDFFFLGGDLNHDRVVNNADFQVLYANFGKTGMSYANGDLNRDGKVDFADYQQLGLLFNKTLAAPAESVQSGAVEAPVVPVTPVTAPKPLPKKKTESVVTAISAPAPAPKPAAVKRPVSFGTRRIK